MSVTLAPEVAFCIAKPPTPKSGLPSEKRKADDGTTPPPKKLKSSKPLKNTRQVDKWKTDTTGLRKLRDDMQNVCFSLTASAPSTSTLITHQLFRSHNSSKNNNNNKNNKNTPAYSSGLGWAPHLHISISASLPSVYCTTICTN